MRRAGRETTSFTPGVFLWLALALAFASVSSVAQTPASSKGMAIENTAKAIAFRNTMRQLWEEHIIWTRQVIVSQAAGLPDLDLAIARLMQNQVDIGNAVKPYYGEAAGNKLTTLLKEHIGLAAEILTAAKANDTAKYNDAKTRWYANADTIAVTLSALNPKYWSEAPMKFEMKKHLDTTLDEATARLHGDWKADIAAYDRVERHILMMADMLSLGIIRQYPNKFK